jgi:polyisoprenoid-binding protein YceI
MKAAALFFAVVLGVVCASDAMAASETYVLDPTRTYPSFEADHFGGVSAFRGKFKKTTGKVTIDRDAKTGTMEATIDMSSIDIGLDALDADLRSPNFFDVAKYLTGVYQGTVFRFDGNIPVEVIGAHPARRD